MWFCLGLGESFALRIVRWLPAYFDTRYRMFAYTLLRNKTLLFPKWHQKPTCPILRCSSVVNLAEGNFTNFENSYKDNGNSYHDTLFTVGNQKTGEIYITKTIWVSGTLNSSLELHKNVFFFSLLSHILLFELFDINYVLSSQIPQVRKSKYS